MVENGGILDGDRVGGPSPWRTRRSMADRRHQYLVPLMERAGHFWQPLGFAFVVGAVSDKLGHYLVGDVLTP
jgi:hypothetical protein